MNRGGGGCTVHPPRPNLIPLQTYMYVGLLSFTLTVQCTFSFILILNNNQRLHVHVCCDDTCQIKSILLNLFMLMFLFCWVNQSKPFCNFILFHLFSWSNFNIITFHILISEKVIISYRKNNIFFHLYRKLSTTCAILTTALSWLPGFKKLHNFLIQFSNFHHLSSNEVIKTLE